MKLMVNHQTQYSYAAPARNSIQYIKMIPQSFAHQLVHHWALSVPGRQNQQFDGFGNVWVTSTLRESHQHMMIMAQGIVELSDAVDGIQDERYSPLLFLQSTASTQCDPEMQQFACMNLTTRDRAGLQQLSASILAYMPYSTGSTRVEMTAAEAFRQQKGVCQDHTQVFIAMCRHLGVPARYVSGYLYAAHSSHLATHAWAEVYLDGYWFCFDTSNQLFQPNAHIQLAIGRDYADVAPIRGIREKGIFERMTSMVQVLPC